MVFYKNIVFPLFPPTKMAFYFLSHFEFKTCFCKWSLNIKPKNLDFDEWAYICKSYNISFHFNHISLVMKHFICEMIKYKRLCASERKQQTLNTIKQLLTISYQQPCHKEGRKSFLFYHLFSTCQSAFPTFWRAWIKKYSILYN